jgi:lysophospholipase L1-like esterase
VVFSGINDLRHAIANYDYLHYASTVPGRSLPLLRMMATDRQIPRRLHRLLRRTVGSREALEKETLESIPLKSEQYAKIAIRKSAPVSAAMPRTDLSSYGGNLRTLVGVARAHGSRLVLMTQATTWNSRIDRTAAEWHWMRFAKGVTYREDLIDEAMESMNAVMRVLAEEYGVPLYDLARVMPKSSEYFYDDVHFNVAGASRAGKELALVIRDDVVGLHESGSSPTADPAG